MMRVSEDKKAEIVKTYLENPDMRYKGIAERFGVSGNFVGKTIKTHLQAGNGIKPDRRNGCTEDELDAKHAKVMAEKYPHPRTIDWMAHVKPLNAHKRELELKVEHKQAELEAARQELRDFTATLRKLMEDTT